MTTPTPATAQTGDNSNYVKPKTRQRIYKEPPPLEVPNINEDAAERKRVLNVLAQRRYRLVLPIYLLKVYSLMCFY